METITVKVLAQNASGIFVQHGAGLLRSAYDSIGNVNRCWLNFSAIKIRHQPTGFALVTLPTGLARVKGMM